MTEANDDFFPAVEAWAAGARAKGWLTDEHLAALARVQRASAADLFEQGAARPLVIALFGGTGVGKSSLLNRLAGSAIARVGIERPTSHEVTLYLHEEVALKDLPAELPLDKIRIVRHRESARREVMWIDMPDFDSTEQSNRALALQWLAHVDLLLYVMSPERYRDDAGWRLLRERGGRHGWMFILNHWDEGDPAQRDDLQRILANAGFDDPVILATCCGEQVCADDQFAQLEQEIQTLLAQHGLDELERLGHQVRARDLLAALNHAASPMGSADDWEQLTQGLGTSWEQTADAVVDGLQWPIQQVAARFGADTQNWQQRLPKLMGLPSTDTSANEEAPGMQRVAEQVWDDWARDRIDEWLRRAEIDIHRHKLAPAPLLQRIRSVTTENKTVVGDSLQQHLRSGIARPGTSWQRFWYRASGAALTILPLSAAAWISWHVVHGFLRGTSGGGEFMGTGFAINSVLLLLLSWLLPFLLHRKLKPSLVKTAQRALHQGLEQGLDELREHWRSAVDEAANEAEIIRREAAELAQHIAPADAGTREQAPALARVLASAAKDGL